MAKIRRPKREKEKIPASESVAYSAQPLSRMFTGQERTEGDKRANTGSWLKNS